MVNKRTAAVAFKTEDGAEHSNGREKKDSKVKIEEESEEDLELPEDMDEESESDDGRDRKAETATMAAWEELDVPWKHRGFPEEDGDEDVMSIIGCGTLASSIFEGILHKYDDEGFMEQFNHRGVMSFPPYRFILNCSSSDSCKRLTKQFVTERRNDEFPGLKVVQGNDVAVARSATKQVMLGCKPAAVSGILGQKGMKEALKGKVLISIVAGVSNEELEKALYGNYDPKATDRCRIVRVLANTSAKICQSMSVIAIPPHKDLEPQEWDILEFLIGCVGEYVKLPVDKIDAATAVVSSGPAFYLLMLEGVIDGAVAMGIPRKEATLMAAQTMKGAALGVTGGHYGDDEDADFSGTSPATLRDEIATPGGCTMGGLMVLEEAGVRGTVAKCIRRTTVVASQLGGGAKNVNGV